MFPSIYWISALLCLELRKKITGLQEPSGLHLRFPPMGNHLPLTSRRNTAKLSPQYFFTEKENFLQQQKWNGLAHLVWKPLEAWDHRNATIPSEPFGDAARYRWRGNLGNEINVRNQGKSFPKLGRMQVKTKKWGGKMRNDKILFDC